MAWQPIQSTPYAYLFTPVDGQTFDGSLVSGGGDWTLRVYGRVRLRITALNYSTDAEDAASFDWTTDGVSQSVLNTGGDASWVPSPFEVELDNGILAFTGSGGAAESYQFLVEIADVCDEVGSATYCRVSAYQRYRVFVARLYSAETRCLVGDFNAAIAPGRRILRSQWDTYGQAYVDMSRQYIAEDGRSAGVTIRTQWSGAAVIKQTVTLDNGEIYTQQYRVEVAPQTAYPGETFTSGPSSVAVEVGP